MKKMFLVLLLVMVAAVAQNASETGTQTTGADAANTAASTAVIPKPVRALYMAGKGIAVNPDDLTDFKLLKASAGRIKVKDHEKGLGVLHVDDKRYVMRDIQVGNGSFYAVLYDGLQASEPAGKISLDRVDKPVGEVWAGVLSLNGNEYYAYVLGFHRPVPVKEAVDRVTEFCKAHPDNQRCKEVKQVAQNKIKAYCANHPDDRRCKAVVAAYCANNAEDMSCRARLKEYCEKNPNAAVCNTQATGPRAGEETSNAARIIKAVKARQNKQEVLNCYKECIKACATGEDNTTATAADFSCAVKCRRGCAWQPEKVQAVKTRVTEQVRTEKERMPELRRKVKIVPVPLRRAVINNSIEGVEVNA